MDPALTCALFGRGQHPARVKFMVLPKRGLQIWKTTCLIWGGLPSAALWGSWPLACHRGGKCRRNEESSSVRRLPRSPGQPLAAPTREFRFGRSAQTDLRQSAHSNGCAERKGEKRAITVKIGGIQAWGACSLGAPNPGRRRSPAELAAEVRKTKWRERPLYLRYWKGHE